MGIRARTERGRSWLKQLSFRTGLCVLFLAIPLYVAAFAQFWLPISTTWKGILWFVFFGLAKCAQYGGLTILGVKGWCHLKNYVRHKKGKQ